MKKEGYYDGYSDFEIISVLSNITLKEDAIFVSKHTISEEDKTENEYVSIGTIISAALCEIKDIKGGNVYQDIVVIHCPFPNEVQTSRLNTDGHIFSYSEYFKRCQHLGIEPLDYKPKIQSIVKKGLYESDDVYLIKL